MQDAYKAFGFALRSFVQIKFGQQSGMLIIEPGQHRLLHPRIAGQFSDQRIVQPQLVAGHIGGFG
ncbi:hypothetical protein D9M68_690940 [compost metagenome]